MNSILPVLDHPNANLPISKMMITTEKTRTGLLPAVPTPIAFQMIPSILPRVVLPRLPQRRRLTNFRVTITCPPDLIKQLLKLFGKLQLRSGLPNDADKGLLSAMTTTLLAIHPLTARVPLAARMGSWRSVMGARHLNQAQNAPLAHDEHRLRHGRKRGCLGADARP